MNIRILKKSDDYFNLLNALLLGAGTDNEYYARKNAGLTQAELAKRNRNTFLKVKFTRKSTFGKVFLLYLQSESLIMILTFAFAKDLWFETFRSIASPFPEGEDLGEGLRG